MYKKASVKDFVYSAKLFMAFYWFDTGYMQNIRREMFILFCMIIYSIGNIGYMVHCYQSRVSFVEMSFSLTFLVSSTFAMSVIYIVKNKSKHARELNYLIDNNPYLSVKDAKVQRNFQLSNKLQMIVFGYILLFAVTSLVFVELKSCDEELQKFSCGYLVPSVTIFLVDAIQVILVILDCFQYFFSDNIGSLFRRFYNILLVCFISYIGVGLLTTFILIHSTLMHLETFLNVFTSTLEKARNSKDKTTRYNKLIIAYKQHIFMKKQEHYFRKYFIEFLKLPNLIF